MTSTSVSTPPSMASSAARTPGSSPISISFRASTIVAGVLAPPSISMVRDAMARTTVSLVCCRTAFTARRTSATVGSRKTNRRPSLSTWSNRLSAALTRSRLASGSARTGSSSSGRSHSNRSRQLGHARPNEYVFPYVAMRTCINA
ncbi:MAG TPA: hypothetical protein DCQ64_22170 [Candidatus Rokubacteria bacterium]|nr:hypothetical protein [Candidatus Rokubacteria bacterium]